MGQASGHLTEGRESILLLHLLVELGVLDRDGDLRGQARQELNLFPGERIAHAIVEARAIDAVLDRVTEAYYLQDPNGLGAIDLFDERGDFRPQP